MWDRIVKWLEHDTERIQFFDASMFKSCRLGLLPNSVNILNFFNKCNLLSMLFFLVLYGSCQATHTRIE